MPRQTVTRSIGSTEVRLTQLKNRDALVTFALACRIFGRVGVELIAEFVGELAKGAGKKSKGKKGKGKKADGLDIMAIVQAPETIARVMSTLVVGLSQASLDDVDALADALLGGVCEVNVEGGWVKIPEDGGRAVVDEVFPNVFALLGALRFSLEHNFLPTLAGPSTGENTNPSTSEGTTTPTSPGA